jgi:hypothetical protein
MKKLLFVLMSVFAVQTFADPVPQAAAPRAATFQAGIYVCPVGWTLVQTQRYVTYNQIVGYQQQLVCGPLGVLCHVQNVPITQPVTQLVPANYCVPGTIVVTPVVPVNPGPFVPVLR